MARKAIVPPGLKRGGRGKGKATVPVFPPIAKGKGKGKPVVPPIAARGGPPPRARATAGMPPPSQVPVQRGRPMPDLDAKADAMGPATSAAVAGSPGRRRAAAALRGGGMAF